MGPFFRGGGGRSITTAAPLCYLHNCTVCLSRKLSNDPRLIYQNAAILLPDRFSGKRLFISSDVDDRCDDYFDFGVISLPGGISTSSDMDLFSTLFFVFFMHSLVYLLTNYGSKPTTSNAMGRLTKGETVNEKRGYSSAGSAGETRAKSRAATPNTLGSRGGLLKDNNMEVTLSRPPSTPSSLVFSAADSESDSDNRPDDRPRRRCSIGTRGSAPDIHDLRLLERGSASRRSSYELSVCSAGSLETMQTNDDKMMVFEVTLPASLKNAVAKEMAKDNADYSSGSEGDDEKSGGLIQALKARRRFSMETIWSTHKKAIPKGTSVASSLGDPIESSVTHKNPRKVRARRCAQATVILVVLAMIVVLPWLVITIYFGVEGNDPTSLISSITAKIPGMINGLFDSQDEKEVQPPPVPAGVNRRQEEDNLHRRERIARERQARIQAIRRRQAREQQRERRMQKQKSLQPNEDNK